MDRDQFIFWVCWKAVAILFSAWVIISWMEVIAKNTSPDPVYMCWNFFKLLS